MLLYTFSWEHVNDEASLCRPYHTFFLFMVARSSVAIARLYHYILRRVYFLYFSFLSRFHSYWSCTWHTSWHMCISPTTTSLSTLTLTLSEGVDRRSSPTVCLSVCLFACSITRKRMIPKCSNLICFGRWKVNSKVKVRVMINSNTAWVRELYKYECFLVSAIFN